VQAWNLARAGKNILLATGTASGKTLAFHLPVISGLIEDRSARALYLFPTKALAHDQLAGLQALQSKIEHLTSAVYDGDTAQKDRAAIRRNARVVLSNPDMLHTGILPHHVNWNDLLANLKYVVIDEAHIYRGVFGSHVANVIRRLKRVAKFHGSRPQFLLASATIGNPQELAGRLIEESVELVDEDGSPRGERHFLIYNPPITDPALGLRKSSLLESVRLANDLLAWDVQSVVFARTRRSVEIILTYLQGGDSSGPAARQRSQVRGYRSGYLPYQRREIELGLRDGGIRMVVATNALELGIDIGGMGAAVLVGYPGTIASARQQAGRAGRRDAPAVSILVVSSHPLDQFLAHHPQYFFGRSPEQGLLDPNHLLILLEHLRCAMFELPFRKEEGFGNLTPDLLRDYLNFLVDNRESVLSNETYFWMRDQYPAAGISLRSASPQSVTLQSTSEDGRPVVIGTVDGESAAWMVHPGAIYMHEAQQYFVQELSLDNHVAQLVPVGMDYYTEAQRRSDITITTQKVRALVPGGEKAHGEIEVTTQVVGFKKLRWFTFENLGEEPLDLPPSTLQTTGYWIMLSTDTVAGLREAGLWSNDPNEYGPIWPQIREQVRARDGFRCQVCGAAEDGRQHDVHHKIPFRTFQSAALANRLENLITLCRNCHQKTEQNVRMRSGLAGLGYLLGNLAPIYLMCDTRDLGVHNDPTGTITGQPTVFLYDLIPAGIGFSQRLFEVHDRLIASARDLVEACSCNDGCPSCVGPGGENGLGGKKESLAILRNLLN
jgi:DEAD/DEAH box helicase domain-containing protein